MWKIVVLLRIAAHFLRHLANVLHINFTSLLLHTFAIFVLCLSWLLWLSLAFTCVAFVNVSVVSLCVASAYPD